MSHQCHHPHCTREIPAAMLACKHHWRSLPQKIQDAIWREYRSGQEVTKNPSSRYLAVQQLACAYFVFLPHDEGAALEAMTYLKNAVAFSRKAIEEGRGDPLENLVPKDWPVQKARGRAKKL